VRKYWIIMIMAVLAIILSVGCSKKNGSDAGVSPSPGASQAVSSTPASTAMTSPNASSAPSSSPLSGTGNPAATKAPEPSITMDQVKKLDMNSTFADFEKIAGKTLKPIKEENGKKTYEVKIANETNKYMEVTYTSDGKLVEQKVFMK
jgi:hypothetical protein